MTPLLQEEFLIRTALWTPDGTVVLVVGDRDGTGQQLFFIELQSGALKVLIEDGSLIRNMVWGP